MTAARVAPAKKRGRGGTQPTYLPPPPPVGAVSDRGVEVVLERERATV
jgi:hypothetical protein